MKLGNIRVWPKERVKELERFPHISCWKSRSVLDKFVRGCKYVVFCMDSFYVVNFQIYDMAEKGISISDYFKKEIA